MHLINLYFHIPTSTLFYQKTSTCTCIFCSRPPTVMLKNGVCVSLQINNIELGNEIFIPLESLWHALQHNINFYFIYWRMPLILVDSNLHLSCIGSAILNLLPRVKYTRRELVWGLFSHALDNTFISIVHKNNEMLPCDKMDHTDIGTSTIGHYAQPMMWVEDETVKLRLWTNT
jgi:hypothetical protein